MKSISRKTKLWLIITLAVILVTSISSSLIQNNFFRTDVSVHYQTLEEVSNEIEVNNEEYNKNIEVTFTTSKTASMSYKLLVPKNATEDTPAPAIVIMHGGLANKESVSNLFVEWARRGYVVLAFDAMGHGKTDRAVDGLTNNTMGMLAMTELAMSLPYVDENQIGLTGHSWGNQGAALTVNEINLNSSNPKIKALLVSQGSLAEFDLLPGAIDNVIYGFSVGKYDEMDTVYWNAYTLLSSDWAKSWISTMYTDFSEDEVTEGAWYTPDGPVELNEGTAINTNNVRVLYNPHNTHPAALFSTTATKVNINFFYGAFGTPEGVNYISSTHQIWYIMTAFSVIGMLAWISLALPILNVLLVTPVFKKLKKSKEEMDAKILPSIKTPKEYIPLIVMFLFLTVFSALSIIPLTQEGSRLIPLSKFFPNAVHLANSFGYWSLITGLVVIVVFTTIYAVKKYIYRLTKDSFIPGNPFEPVDVGSRKIFHSISLGIVVAAILYVILFVIYGLFKVDFRISTVEFTTFKLDHIFVLFRYVGLFGVFYIANAILIANTRYKDLPDWVTTGIIMLGNILGISIFLFVQYHSLISKGVLFSPDSSSTILVLWFNIPSMLLSPIISKHAYKKTGNIWVGAAINAFLFTMAIVGTGQYMSYDITAFGL